MGLNLNTKFIYESEHKLIQLAQTLFYIFLVKLDFDITHHVGAIVGFSTMANFCDEKFGFWSI